MQSSLFLNRRIKGKELVDKTFTSRPSVLS